jgi:membrane-bound serine protease (ClpP class)
MVAEVVTPTVGVLGAGGVIAFVAGSIMLFDSELPAYRVSLPIVAAVAAASAGIFILGLGAAARARRLRVSTGREAMLGAPAVALEDFTETGRVRAFSESWQARSAQPVHKGDKLRITAIDGLVLTVEADRVIDAGGGATQGSVAEG